MKSYYCPYCSKNYQFNDDEIQDNMICIECKDPLIKEVLIRPIQIIALLIVAAFITPLIIFFMTYFKNESKQEYEESTVNVEIVNKQ